ncbi:MAG TPA: fibronectin type III domain-containing protein [Spirochaetota bacterium]|nr:fibronectin type III domain-containing protein [Spirochaetota bacterium]HOD15969.1 fibronectin type III domain-containing protein [Spirochaetota bacterium]HPG51098.1 fibronectin type III domain-containing protein [Spirochaetota bacterium]HPN10999.1 fibronectin type III domain-containing protein [Spirochaetota bacterium]
MDDDFDRAMKIEALPLEIIIADRNEPVPGDDGLITNNTISNTSVQLLWSPATDVETEQGDLEYCLYMSPSNNISTPAEALRNGTVVHVWDAGMVTAIVTGLTPATNYFFNVVVRDGDGLNAAYRTVSITTETDSVYMFPAGSFQGDFGAAKSLSVVPVRDTIDSLCMQARLNDYSDLPCLNVRAFISVSASDAIAGMPGNYGVPANRKITGPTDATVADYWADLLDGTIAVTLSEGEVAPDDWWSGSKSDGTFDTDDNCSGWTSTGSKGVSGKNNKSNNEWIAGNVPNCSAKQLVLCVCW